MPQPPTRMAAQQAASREFGPFKLSGVFCLVPQRYFACRTRCFATGHKVIPTPAKHSPPSPSVSPQDI